METVKIWLRGEWHPDPEDYFSEEEVKETKIVDHGLRE